VPVFCLYIGETCAVPCNRHKKTPDDGVTGSCSCHTPVDPN
jgi:hypothetical protein